LASGCFLLLEHWDYVPRVADWAQASVIGVFLLTFFLTLMNIVAAIWKFFQPHALVVRALNKRSRMKYVRGRIEEMTPKEKEIIGYLLAHNQRVFVGANDGGHARALLATRIIEVVAQPGQIISHNDFPFAVPMVVWEELLKHKEKFPYTAPVGEERVRYPWREGRF
jgi:hypothetical protein